MKRFKLMHKRDRHYKAAVFMFVILAASLVYLNYGSPTGFVTNPNGQYDNVLDNVMKNEQVMLFAEYHPLYSVEIRELDYLELALEKERRPDYSSLEGRHFEIKFSSGDANIIAIANGQGVVKIYNLDVE